MYNEKEYHEYEEEVARKKEEEKRLAEEEEKRKEQERKEQRSYLKEREENYDFIKRIQGEMYDLNDSFQASANHMTETLLSLPVNRRKTAISRTYSQSPAPTRTAPTTTKPSVEVTHKVVAVEKTNIPRL